MYKAKKIKRAKVKRSMDRKSKVEKSNRHGVKEFKRSKWHISKGQEVNRLLAKINRSKRLKFKCSRDQERLEVNG